MYPTERYKTNPNCDRLVCFVYDIIYTNPDAKLPKVHEKIMERLQKYGLPVFERYQKKDTSDLQQAFR